MYLSALLMRAKRFITMCEFQSAICANERYTHMFAFFDFLMAMLLLRSDQHAARAGHHYRGLGYLAEFPADQIGKARLGPGLEELKLHLAQSHFAADTLRGLLSQVEAGRGPRNRGR